MEHCSYEEFGVAFFEYAVSEEKVLASVREMAAEPIDMGPVGVGPGGAAQVRATGSVGEPEATRLPGELIRYRVVLPVSLDFTVDLQLDKHEFHGDLRVPLEILARATTDLQVEIVVEPPRSRDVELDLKASGLRASVLKKVANIDVEVKKFVAKYIQDEVAKDADSRLVDIRASIDAQDL
ncbi:MAG: hypothetical protein PGN07_00010 [Aeromicrobium erythreum]